MMAFRCVFGADKMKIIYGVAKSDVGAINRTIGTRPITGRRRGAAC